MISYTWLGGFSINDNNVFSELKTGIYLNHLTLVKISSTFKITKNKTWHLKTKIKIGDLNSGDCT